MPGYGKSIVRRIRKCAECQRTFRSPEALRRHRYAFGTCRSEAALLAVGFRRNGKGEWIYDAKEFQL